MCDRSREDIETFIDCWCAGPGSKEHLGRLVSSEKEFTKTIVDRSENNFMYVKYILEDIKAGRFIHTDMRACPEKA